MTSAELIDEELARLWPQRGWTRGIPKWEIRLAVQAVKELKENEIEPKLFCIGDMSVGYRKVDCKEFLEKELTKNKNYV